MLVWLLAGDPPDDAGRWRGALGADGWTPALVETLAKGLAAAPDGRFADIAAWHAAVREAVEPTVISPPGDLGHATGSDFGSTVVGTTQVMAGPPLARWRRWLVGAAVVLAVAAAGVAGAVLAGRGDDDGPEQTVEQLEGGQVRIEAAAGERRITLTGPSEIAVGETATFVVETDGVEHWVWFGPDGGVHPDVPELQVETRSPGTATVRLRGVDGQNRELDVVHRLDVVEE